VVKKETGLWAGFFLPGRKKKRFQRNRRAEEHTSAVKKYALFKQTIARKSSFGRPNRKRVALCVKC
jgi:hypothetical protein